MLIVRLLLAALLFARLGGLTGLPPAPYTAAMLIALVAWDRWRARGGTPQSLRRSVDPYGVALASILVATVLVRLPSIGADFGHQPPDIDGHRLADSIRHYFLTGEIEHRTVEHYPGLVFWGMSASALILFFWKLMTGAVKAIEYTTVEQFMLAGRLFNVAVAAGLVACTAEIARRLSGRTAAIAAAAVVALAPLSIETTTDTRNDPGQVLLVAAAVLASFIAVERRGAWLAVAGACAGLATGIKYTSVFAFVPVVIAGFEAEPGRRWRQIGIASAAFAVSLAVSNHFVWWDFPNFLRQLSDQVIITGPRHWAASANPSAMHRTVLATVGPGWPLLLLAAGWGAWTLASGAPRAWLFWSFPLLYSWFTTHRPSQFPRWVFPLLPFVAIAGACALASVTRAVRQSAGSVNTARSGMRGRAIAVAVALLVLGPPLAGGAGVLSRRLEPTTAVLLESWLREHVKADQVVLTEDGWLDLRDARFGVVRVPDLGWALAANRHAGAAADWIVVPETAFSRVPAGLVQLHAVEATTREFFGHLGFDYRVYAAPRIAPATAAEVALAAPDAAAWLGWSWAGPAGSPQGRVVPERQGWLFVPPVASASPALTFDVAADGTGSPPVEVFVAGRQLRLSATDAAEPGVRRFTASLGSRSSDRALAVLIEPVPRESRVRLLRVRVG
jgi:4-amino-4-deoxy-L-arabinose transferase-like glycosyltransferase